MTKHFSPLEFKDADVDPNELVTKALADLEKTIGERIKALETKGLDPKLVERLDKIEAKANRPHGGAASSDEAKELETKALNDYLRSGTHSGVEKKALTIGGSPVSGADLVAPEFSAQLITKLVQFSPMRSVADVLSIGTGSIIFPVENAAMAPTWVTETGERQESNPTFANLQIDAFELAGIVPVSRQMLEDSIIDLSGYVSNQFAQQFGKAEATKFVTGNGSGSPTGFLNNPALFTQVTAKQDGSNILDKLIALFYSLPGFYANSGVWLMNRKTMGIIRAKAVLADNAILWSDGLAGGTPPTLLGRPVVEAVDMPDLVGTGSPVSATYPIAFGDFKSMYRIVDRVSLNILRDDFTAASTGLVKFHGRRRVGGKVVQAEAVQLIKATVSGS